MNVVLCFLIGGIRPLDVGLIVDQTLTLGANDWVSVLDFLKRIVNGLGVSASPSGTRIGIVRFTSKPTTALYFNTIKDEDLEADNVNKFIDPISQMLGERRIDLALQRAATDLFSTKEGSRPNAKKVMKVFKAKVNSHCIAFSFVVFLPCVTKSKMPRFHYYPCQLKLELHDSQNVNLDRDEICSSASRLHC